MPSGRAASSPRRRVLFVAEAVTLAQVVRLATLARSLDPTRYEVHFASSRFDELIFSGATFTRHQIFSLEPGEVERAVNKGARIYDQRTLARYLEDDVRLLREVRPALVVGDLRLSLSVAAPLAGVPHATLVNAYWSPFAVRDGFPLPDHPIVKLLGPSVAARYFPIALPKVFAHFARPVNALRRKHGLTEVGSLPETLTHGDLTLFPDVPELVPAAGAPPHHRYLGPVLWSPPVALPPWWEALDPKRPTVYVTLGSSGKADLLPMVLHAAAGLGLQVIASTAGRALPSGLPAGCYAARYLPGHLAARRAFAVVSNGGSTTGYQALAEGRPVAGVAFNLDQYLAMTAIERAGAGLLLRSGTLKAELVAAALTRLLEDPAPTRAAAALAATFAAWDAARVFRDIVDEATGPSSAAGA